MQIKRHANGRYYCHYRSANGPVELSLKTSSRAEAAALAASAGIARIEHLAKANALTQEAITRAVSSRRTTCASAVTIWAEWALSVGLQPVTRNLYRQSILAFLRDRELGAKPVSAINERELNEWVNSDGLSLAARMGRLRAVKNYCGVLSGKGLISGSPAELIRIRYDDLTHEQKETKHREPFTVDEQKRLLTGLPTEWAAMSALSLNTGFRLSDCACIEHACFTEAGVAVWMDKVNKRLELPLAAPVRKVLAGVEEDHPRFVFPKFAELAHDVNRRSHLSTYFKREAAKCGVVGKGFHSFRHTFATERSQLGDTLDEIRLKLGHELPATTSIYVHVE